LLAHAEVIAGLRSVLAGGQGGRGVGRVEDALDRPDAGGQFLAVAQVAEGLRVHRRVIRWPDHLHRAEPAVGARHHAQEGGVPGFEVLAWLGIVVPAGTPRPIVNQLNVELGRTMQAADVRGANLEEADLRDANLQDANLAGANLLCADLRNVDLQGANLQQAVLYGANLRDAILQDADVSGAIISKQHLAQYQPLFSPAQIAQLNVVQD
jgi:hypothetical protein